MEEAEYKTVAFFGKITAGITHEMRNVLAIIGESSGLMEDILSLRRESSLPHQDRFQDALSSIQGQVRRGVELAANLNKFAHSTDQPTERINIYDVIERIVGLSQRLARLKNITLQTRQPEESFHMVTSLVEFQMAVFAGIECCLNHTGAGDCVSVHLKKSGQGCSIHTVCENALSSPAQFIHDVSVTEAWRSLKELVVCLGGNAEFEDSKPGILLSFPEK